MAVTTTRKVGVNDKHFTLSTPPPQGLPPPASTEGKLGHRHNDNAAESTNYSWFSKQIERGNGSNALEVFKDIIITFKKANLKKQTE